MLHGITFLQVKPTVRIDRILQMMMESLILFYGPHRSPRLQERLGQCAQAGSDLHDRIRCRNLGEFDGLPHDIAIDQEILPQKPARRVTQAGQELTGFVR